jgi:hypothetical protein
VERQNPSASATMNWEVCKSGIALYGLYVNMSKRDCNQSANKSSDPLIWEWTSFKTF